MINAPTPEDAHAAFRLFQSAMDLRVGIWNDQRTLETGPTGKSLRRFWDLNRKRLEATVKERRKAVEQLLYGLDVMRWTQAPWL